VATPPEGSNTRTSESVTPGLPPPTAAGALVGGTAGDVSFAGGSGREITGALLDVGTDVTAQLDAAIPAFGNVLTAIGNGVANSQQALDQGVISTVQTLNNTTITVVTEVIEVLNEDGLPDAAQTQVITQDLSLLNFFTPTLHEWKNVQISMDLEVGSFHRDQGVQFSARQHKESATATGLFWGFLGWFDMESKTTSQSSSSAVTNEVAWQQGQVRVDALLGPRTTNRFQSPDRISIGPQIFVVQGALSEQTTAGVTTARSVDLRIEVRRADGGPNPGKTIVLDAGGLLPSFPGAGGATTDPNGLVTARLTRSLGAGVTGFRQFNVAVSLGQIRKTATITL